MIQHYMVDKFHSKARKLYETVGSYSTIQRLPSSSLPHNIHRSFCFFLVFWNMFLLLSHFRTNITTVMCLQWILAKDALTYSDISLVPTFIHVTEFTIWKTQSLPNITDKAIFFISTKRYDEFNIFFDKFIVSNLKR